MFFFIFVLLYSLVNLTDAAASAAVDQQLELMKNLVSEIGVDDIKNCAPQRYEEWNEAVAIRTSHAKHRAGIPQHACLLANSSEKASAPTFYGASGPGSSAAATASLRELLQTLFQDKSYNIKSFFDAPCGDWLWMQQVDLSKIVYIGGDITTVTVNENNKCFKKPNVHFTLFDLTCKTPPSVDLMLTRDVLFHLKEDVVMKILTNINQSTVRYFLSTTFLVENAKNQFRSQSYEETRKKRGNGTTIGYRDINLMDKPYCLPQPILKVKEDLPGNPRYVALWKIPFSLGKCA